MTVADTPVDNGVNVEALLGARELFGENPDLGKTQWRSITTWQRGTHSTSTIESFFTLGEEQQHRQSFVYDADHPLAFAAEDNGVTPVEFVLVALGSCLTAGVAAIAQQREIQLRSVSATIEAAMDLHGILGADPDIRNGFSDVAVSFAVDADASSADIEALVAQSQKRSAVYDLLTNPTNVTVEVR